jgi:hypothetical protein
MRFPGIYEPPLATCSPPKTASARPSARAAGGFALIQTKSKEGAIEFTRHFLKIAGDGETEIRQLYQHPAK